MGKLENFYLELGVARTATDMEIAQAYRAGVQKIPTLPDASPVQNAQRLDKLEAAYQALLNPEKRKKHDEQLAWHDARQRLDREKEKRLALSLQEKKDAEAEAARLATLRAAEVTRQAAAEAKRLEEEARVYAEADANLRKLRKERIDFGETLPLDTSDGVHPHAVKPQEPDPAAPKPSHRVIGRATIIGSVAAVAVLFAVLLNFRPAAPKVTADPSPPAPLAMPAAAPVSTPTGAAPVPPPEAAPAPSAAAPSGKVPKEDAAKVVEAQQYKKALSRIEAEHPELNARHAAYRTDLMAFVTSRMQVHIKAGYSKAKALEIAVRDLETQDLIHQAIEKNKQQTIAVPQEPAAPPDKGGHTGFDPKCRWVNAQQWSCK